MFKRILCPYDFTAHASRGLAYAVRLARRFRGHLEIVTVRPPYPTAPHPWTPRPLSRTERLTLERELEDAGGTGPLPADARVVIGKPASDITMVAHHDRADLVVMGTHADPAAISPDGSPASITFQVLGRTTIPVLAVPPGAPDPASWLRHDSELILGIDFAEACAAELVEATTVARLYDARLLLVHVIDPRPSAGDCGERSGATGVVRMAQARGALEGLLSVAPPGVPTSGLLLIGEPAEERVFTVQAESLPVARSSEVLIARALSLQAGGHLRDALRTLDAVDRADPIRPEADRIRAEIQRQLLEISRASSLSRLSGGDAR